MIKKASIAVLVLSIFFSSSISLSKEKSISKSDIDTRSKGPYAEKVERNLKQIEDAIQDLHTKYKDGSIWDSPYKGDEESESTGHKLKRYGLLVPTYALRFATWPVAVVGDLLIRKGVVRKVVNVISNKERTFWVYPKLELGFGSGFGGGVGMRHFDLFHKNYKLSASYQIHLNLNQESNVSIGKPDAFYIKGKPVGYKVGTYFFRHHDIDYFGKGPESSLDSRSLFGENEIRTGGFIGYEFLNNLFLVLHNYFIWNSSHSDSGSSPSVDWMFPLSSLTSFERKIWYSDFGLSLMHDDRDSTIIPESGGYRRLAFSRYQGLNTGNFDYNEYDLELVQYIKVMEPRNILALRTKWSYQQQTADGIPFYRLNRYDVDTPARGFEFDRFVDRGLAAFNVEYSFPVWRFMDGQLFFDTGRVFHSPQDFSFKHFKYSGGAGLRLRSSEFFLMRIQFAYGGEGAKFLFKTSQAF